ncbi:MAG: hypothetical protein JXK50_06680 [Campylobacterales bacterium]|nr:hypothetical protein [Campylobacterales bacterium]
MALSNLHTNYTHGSYEKDRDYGLKFKENDRLLLDPRGLANLDAHSDKITSIAIGYGYDLVKNIDNLERDLTKYITSKNATFTASQALSKVKELINNANGVYNDTLATQINSYITLGSRENAEKLLDDSNKKYEEALTSALGSDNLSQSKERAAIISVLYNLAGGETKARLIAAIKSGIPSTIAAIRNDNRAEAWFQIRYASNGGDSRSTGIANRRVGESDMFGLYDTGSIDDESAKEVMRMYTIYKDKIVGEETTFSSAYQGHKAENEISSANKK